MVELFNTSQPIDIVTLGNLLIAKGIYESIGGNDYIKEIINNIPTIMMTPKINETAASTERIKAAAFV